MNENLYAFEIRIRFYEDSGELDIKDLFYNLQNLKAKDYLKLYQLMYQDLVEHQQINYYEEEKCYLKEE